MKQSWLNKTSFYIICFCLDPIKSAGYCLELYYTNKKNLQVCSWFCHFTLNVAVMSKQLSNVLISHGFLIHFSKLDARTITISVIKVEHLYILVEHHTIINITVPPYVSCHSHTYLGVSFLKNRHRITNILSTSCCFVFGC